MAGNRPTFYADRACPHRTISLPKVLLPLSSSRKREHIPLPDKQVQHCRIPNSRMLFRMLSCHPSLPEQRRPELHGSRLHR